MIHIREKSTGEVIQSIESNTLQGADLQGLELCNADLSGLDISGANLRHAMLNGADLSGANLKGADLRMTRLVETDLSQANLADADLEGAWLICANLKNSDLSSARINDALIWNADLRAAQYKDADFHGSAYNGDTVWAKGLNPDEIGVVYMPYWATDQTIGEYRPEGLHTPTEFVPLTDHPHRELLTRVRRSIHRRAGTAKVFMQFCDLPEDDVEKKDGERIWARYSVGAVGKKSWWEAEFLDSKLVFKDNRKPPCEIAYNDIKGISYPTARKNRLQGGILMPRQAEFDGTNFLYDVSVIETHLNKRHEAKAAVGKNGLRDISFWYEVVRGAMLDQERAAEEADAKLSVKKTGKSVPYAVVVIRDLEDNQIIRIHIVSMCEQTIEKLKLTRDLPQGNVVIAAPSGSTRALIKGQTLVLASPVTLQSGEALTINVA